MADDEIVHAGTRRVVGREVLRRMSRLVADWQTEERGKHELARRLAIGLCHSFCRPADGLFIRNL